MPLCTDHTPGVAANPTSFSPSYFHLVNSPAGSSPSSGPGLPPPLAPVPQHVAVAAAPSASHTSEDCWPWSLGLAAAMINASTRQEASTCTCLANIYLLTHITRWWTNLNPHPYTCSTFLPLIPPLPPPPALHNEKQWKRKRGRAVNSHISSLVSEWSKMPHRAHLEGVHAGFRSIRLLPVCILPRGRGGACFFPLFFFVKLKIPQGQMH